jgi:hypothetical protein
VMSPPTFLSKVEFEGDAQSVKNTLLSLYPGIRSFELYSCINSYKGEIRTTDISDVNFLDSNINSYMLESLYRSQQLIILAVTVSNEVRFYL